MRDLAPVAAGVVALFVLLALLGKAFDSSAKQPAHAMELAGVRAEADATRAERDRLQAELTQTRDELKRATDEAYRLRQELADRKASPAGSPKP